jgi:hypothetical protein
VRDVEELLHGVLRARLGSQRTIDEAVRLARRLTGDGASAAALNRRLGADER